MTGVDAAPQIQIHAKGQLVGTLSFTQPGTCSLQYAEGWLRNGYAISPHIPMGGDAPTQTVVNFLRNLFPEGESFDVLLEVESISQSNVYAILSVIGNDTAGALTFTAGAAGTRPAELRLIDEDELVARLSADRGLSVWDGKYRLSMAGIQNKLNVYEQKGGALYLPGSGFASNYIAKSASKRFPTIVANELYCMRLAEAANLDVAKVSIKHFGSHGLLLVKRFDRRDVASGVEKRHIIDGCQSLDLPPGYKYEKPFGAGEHVEHIRTGASLKMLFEFADTTAVPVLTRQRLIDWVIFNLIIANSDAHAKNLSFFVAKNGLSLAPFYDLVSIGYEAQRKDDIDTQLAMSIGDNFDVNQITAYDLLCFADENGIKFDLLKRRIDKLAVVCMNLANRLDFSADNLTDSERTVHAELAKLVISRSEALLTQSRQITEVARVAFSDT
jgi:serine/threonine-protein kinase HipA